MVLDPERLATFFSAEIVSIDPLLSNALKYMDETIPHLRSLANYRDGGSFHIDSYGDPSFEITIAVDGIKKFNFYDDPGIDIVLEKANIGVQGFCTISFPEYERWPFVNMVETVGHKRSGIATTAVSIANIVSNATYEKPVSFGPPEFLISDGGKLLRTHLEQNVDGWHTVNKGTRGERTIGPELQPLTKLQK